MVPKTVGGYEIIRPLGAGGMGQVLLARDPKLERMVALKVLHRDFAVDPTARKRFQREAKSIASLSHPGIVTIYEIGEDQGRDFIVMEFLGGENLRSLVAGGALEQSEILAIVKQIAEAVAGAHGAGVLHRDIKPENIMVDADAGIKVVDFGLARSFDEVDGGRLPSPSSVIDVMACTLELELDSNPNIAQAERQPSEDMQLSAITETILGTPGYMAPELFIGKSPTTASDIYSLGVVLYEMIAGELPFVASSVDALLQLRVHDDAEAPRLDKRPGVAADVADLVVVMLKKKPEERPTIRSVIDQIQAAQDAATQKLRVLQSTSPPLAGLSQEIDVFTPRRRRRALKAATMVSLGAALTAGLLVYRSAASSTTPPVVTNQPLMSTSALETNSIRIAVTPISLELRSYAHANSHVSQGAATMLSTVLNRADAIYAIAPLELQVSAGTEPGDSEEWSRAAKDSGAMYVATGTLREEGGILSGTIEITHSITREVQSFTAKPRPVSELDDMLLELTNLVVARLAPGSSTLAPLDAAQRSVDSLALYETALGALNESRWVDACLHLERIVKEQPEFFEAWYHLAIASAWAAQPTENALRAARKALSLAHNDRDRDFMQVLIHYIQREQNTASVLAAKLALKYPRDPEIAYIHAETVYHNGHYQEALKLFNFALDLAPRSRLASVHPIEHAQANGNLTIWRHFKSLRVNKSDPGVIDAAPTPKIRFALREYEALAALNLDAWSMRALDVLGRTAAADALIPKDQADKGDYLLYRLARAVEEGNPQVQKKLFEKVWQGLSGSSEVAGNHFRLPFVAGLLVAADLKENLRTFVGYWDLKGAKQIGAQEAQLRAHAAVVLGDATMIRSEGFLSWREEMEARALRAELNADHRMAADIWTQLLADPSEHGDNMPRFALARNLAALGDHEKLLAVCTDLVYPKIWVPAYPVYRQRCRAWGALPGMIPAPSSVEDE